MLVHVDLLDRMPATLEALLGGLSDDVVRTRYAPGSYSPNDVVRHLIHGERTDWLPRVRLILDEGGPRTFEPYTPEPPGEPGGPPIETLLADFRSRRQTSVAALRDLALTDDQLDRHGVHPDLGPVTLRELLGAWCAHDVHHLAQICKGLAAVVREDAWPFNDRIGILHAAPV